MYYSVKADHEQMSRAAAGWLLQELGENPDATILVATGNTPIDCYRYLAVGAEEAGLDTARITAVQLDEYLGTGPDDPRSLYAWMDRDFLQPLGIPESNVIRFDATAEQPNEAVELFDREVQEIGGIDIAILGLGPNGHLGFNEPPSTAESPTRIIDLTPESIATSANYWGEEATVPEQAFTAGMPLILGASNILLLVSGAHKRDILRKVVKGPVIPDVPASLLQLVGEKVWVFTDEAAWGARE